MKRTFFVILLCGIVLVSSYAQSSISDLYKQWMIEDINKGKFERAAEEIKHIEDWTFDQNNENSFVEIDNALTFAEYVDSIGVKKSLIDSLYLYIDRECSSFFLNYYYNVNYDAAIFYCALNVGIRRTIFGENHPAYATSLNNLGSAYLNKGDYLKAEQYLMQALEIDKAVLGENCKDYAADLSNIGNLYYDMGDYTKSEQYMLQSLEIKKTIIGENHPSYAVSLNSLGNLYDAMGDYYKAEQYYMEALKIRKSVLGENHEEYAASLNALGDLYLNMGDYSRSEQYFKNASEIKMTIFGENHPSCAVSLNSLGNLYYKKGDYYKAEQYYMKALKIRKSVLGENHPAYAISLNALGDLYLDMGDYSQSEQYYMEALKIRKSVLGENHPSYAVSLNSLGNLYYTKGNYYKAEQYMMQALEIEKAVFGEDNQEYAGCLSSLGNLYNSIGDYLKAEQYLMQVLEIEKAIFGENHRNYAASLSNLVNVYLNKGDYLKAEQYLMQALEIEKAIFGENHPSYAVSVNILGNLYYRKGDYYKAEQYYMEALKIRKSVLGENHPSCAVSLNSLGNLYYRKGNYYKAGQYYQQSLEIEKNISGENSSNYGVALNNLGTLYKDMGDHNNAEKPFMQSWQIYKDNFIQSTSFMSEQQRNSYWHTIQNNFSYSYPSFIYRYYETKPSIATFAYNNELFTKGLLLNSSNAIKRSIIDSGDTTLIRQWKNLSTKKQQIMALEEKEPQSSYLSHLRKEAEELEKEITRKSGAYRENMRLWDITWDSVRDELKPNQVAIEYVSAPLNEDSTMYCALLLRRNYKYPKLIPLFEEKKVTSLLNTSTGDTALINATYIYNKNGKLLSQHIWNKVKPYIKEGEDIYFAPTGILHQIAIENLPYDSTHTMGDIYNLIRLSSTRDLVLHKQSISPTSAALFGGINYDATPEDLYAHRIKPIEDEEEKQPDNTLIAYNANRDSKKPLPGTKIEVREIDKVLTEANVHVQRDTAEIATEEAFKALSGKHKHILHLATHGFYWQDSTAQKEKYFTQRAITMDNNNIPKSIDPLERCGLLFAGANTTLDGKGKRLEEYGVQDGVLTAKEISTMDLRDAELVVLSACETGLGDITGDGVFGLQRAFKMAGAKTIIMSLWKVDDHATQLLMSEFYKNWVTSKGKLSKREAFRKAQNAVRSQYCNPVDWAGFIILD